MVRTAGNQIDAGRLDRAVTKKVSQLHHITANLVKRPGKEVPKIMGKNLGGRNPRLSAQRLHFRPYLFPGQPAPASGEKDLARGQFYFYGRTSAASGTAFGAIGWCVSFPLREISARPARAASTVI